MSVTNLLSRTVRRLRIEALSISQFAGSNRSIPVVYYDGEANAGDQYNELLISRICGKKIFPHLSRKVCSASFRNFAHLYATGSVLRKPNQFSYIWGTGVLCPGAELSGASEDKVFALRGQYTLDEMRLSLRNSNWSVPLGDPGILANALFPVQRSGNNKIGVIPHYAHKTDDSVKKLESILDVKLIDIQNSPSQVLQDIASCRFVLSSSLHGLIFSDALNIPNRRVAFERDLPGGDFKFDDYYTTMSGKMEGNAAIHLSGRDDIRSAIRSIDKITSVRRYLGKKSDLIRAFPNRFVD